MLFTIGGNDLGFSEIIRHCRLGMNCEKRSQLKQPRKHVEPMMDRIRHEVVKYLHTLVPEADIVLVGYPRLFPADFEDLTNCFWLDDVEHPAILNAQNVMQTHGFWVAEDTEAHFIPSLDALAGHELCTDESWFYPITASGRPNPVHDSQPAHPDARGYHEWGLHIVDELQRMGLD